MWIAYLLNSSKLTCTSLQTKNSPTGIRGTVQKMQGPCIRSWDDKFCLHCNIFIYIRHIWIKPVLCSRMVSVFSIILHLEHTDAYSPHPVHIEMEEFSDVRFKQRDVIEFLTAGKSSSNWNSQTKASRLWWSVCWCEYSKMLSKVKSAVRKWFQNQNTNFFLKGGFKKKKLVQRWRKCIDVCGDFVEK